MPLIRDRGVATHPWRMAGADEALAGLDHVVADHARLDEVLAAPGGPFGLAVPNDADAAGLAVHFDALALIAAAFPAFADGRGFSLARRIRRLGFAGELWARGRLIPDQYPFARACGFDAVWVDDDVFARQDEADWRIAASSLSLAYQTGQARWAGAPLSILELRRELPRSLAAE